MKRICPVCKTEFDGRADKKFCCDQCRNTFNNMNKQEENNFSYSTNRLLKKNRQILKTIYEKINKPDNERHSIAKEKLAIQGFKFDYMTNIYKTKTDKTYFFNYDFGYYYEGEFVIIVRKKEYIN